VVLAEQGGELTIGQQRPLDEAGVLDRIAEFLLGGGHGGVGFEQLGGAAAYLFFEFARMVGELPSHVGEGAVEIAEFVLAGRREIDVETAGRQRHGRAVQPPEGPQQEAVHREDEEGEYGEQHQTEGDEGCAHPGVFEEAGVIEIHGGDQVPLQRLEPREGEQLPPSIQRGGRHFHFAGAGAG
jgi:hypothetical protein